MRKRGQINTQVFVYVLAAVIIGVIVLVGFKAIGSVIKSFGMAAVNDFKIQLQADIEKATKETKEVFKCFSKIEKSPQKDQINCMIRAIKLNNNLITINYRLYYNNLYLNDNGFYNNGDLRNVLE